MIVRLGGKKGSSDPEVVKSGVKSGGKGKNGVNNYAPE